MTIRELREYLAGYPDDGEVWMETGRCLSSPVEQIELLNFRGPSEHDLLLRPREGHEWANGHADSRIWAAWKDDPEELIDGLWVHDDGKRVDSTDEGKDS